jgi:hypothetical protein
VIALLLAAALSQSPDNVRLSFALYAFSASADELTTLGKRETGMLKDTSTRIGVKAALLPAYLVVTHRASRSPHRWVRRMGKVARWGLPAMFLGGAVHNLRQKSPH